MWYRLEIVQAKLVSIVLMRLLWRQRKIHICNTIDLNFTELNRLFENGMKTVVVRVGCSVVSKTGLLTVAFIV